MTNNELQETTITDTLIKYYVEIHQSLKTDYIGCDGAKPNHTDWSKLMEEDPYFEEVQ